LPSLQTVVLGSWAVQVSSDSLHEPKQLLSVVTSGVQGSPVCPQTPAPLQVSVPLQYKLSLQPVPFASGPVQASAASLQLSLQFGPTSCPAHGLPVCTEQLPPEHVSVPLQYAPSLHALELFVYRHVPPTPPQLSFVQPLKSLQDDDAQQINPTHWFEMQSSLMVQEFPFVTL